MLHLADNKSIYFGSPKEHKILMLVLAEKKIVSCWISQITKQLILGLAKNKSTYFGAIYLRLVSKSSPFPRYARWEGERVLLIYDGVPQEFVPLGYRVEIAHGPLVVIQQHQGPVVIQQY